jgi:bacterioferritin-associated ferredoxin
VYVCLCRGVTHKTIIEVIEAGARSVEDVASGCRAGTSCGGCVPAVVRLLDEQPSPQEAA